MMLVTKYQISSINSWWEKCDEKCAYMFNVYKDQLSRQTGLLLLGITFFYENNVKTTNYDFYKLFLNYTPAPRRGRGVYCFTSVRPSVQDIFVAFFSVTVDGRNLIFGHKQTLPIIWHTYMKLVTKYQIPVINSCWEKCDEKCAYVKRYAILL
jgi:hypothetical protein